MWETIAIIGLLGGLEFTLWSVQRRHEKQSEEEDRIMQSKQLEVLDGILTELAIQNSVEDTAGTGPSPSKL